MMTQFAMPSSELDSGVANTFAQGVRALTRAVQGLPIAGWEVSCRISATGCSTDRLLLGFDTQGVSALRLAGLARELDMPAPLAAEFQEGLASTARILLAVEWASNGLELRAYQSFRDVDRGMRGFKWVGQDPRRQRITEYLAATQTWQSLLKFYEAQAARYRQSGSGIMGPVMDVAGKIVGQAMKMRSPSQAVEFFSVSERTGARASSCFRLYETGVTYTAIKAHVTRLLSHYQMNNELSRVQALMATRPLGWVAVGEDSLGIPFLTLYGEASVLDARRFMVFGAGR